MVAVAKTAPSQSRLCNALFTDARGKQAVFADFYRA